MNNAENRPLTDVAAAVLLRADGTFLLAQRPPGKAYAGYWEFPGGKVEAGETPAEALSREICEELNVRISCAYPWLTQTFSYPHARVQLHFYRVLAWDGEPQAQEGQVLSWESTKALSVSPLLPANGPILRGLSLPHIMGVSHAADIGVDAFLQKLDAALKQGLNLLQIREPNFSTEELMAFVDRVRYATREFDLRLLLNGNAELARRAGIEGLHLKARQLLQTKTRPEFAWCGASCHNPEELTHAAQLGLDYVVLGPTLATATHPGAAPLGWERVAEWIHNYPLPVYCIGGMGAQDVQRAWSHGAHGIAMLRGLAQCA